MAQAINGTSDISKESSKPETGGSKHITKKSRNRKVTSCLECSRRKQKCNRQWPCNHCLSRRAANLCRFSPEMTTKLAKQKGEVSVQTKTRNSTHLEIRTELHQESSVSAEIVPTESSVQILESLGYLANGAGNIVEDFKCLGLADESKKDLDSSITTSSAHKAVRQAIVLNLFPPRTTVDFLVQHFLDVVNWLHEMVYPPTFLEQYYTWWSPSEEFSERDLQFGVLVLRVCVNSLQFLPNLSRRSRELDGQSLEDLMTRCTAAASKLDSLRSTSSSLIRVQQLLFSVCCLKNAGDIKGSWLVLGEAAREAQELCLHTEVSGSDMSDFEKEMRRRVFWSLYDWDRFMSNFLGRWPCIPDHYITVSLPQDKLQMPGMSEESPTSFTDRIIHFKISRFMSTFKSSLIQSTKDILELVLTTKLQFHREIIDQLPPALRMSNPDTTYDNMLPKITLKRETVRLAVWWSLAGISKPILDITQARQTSQDSKSISKMTENDAKDLSRQDIAKVFLALLEALTETLSTTFNLHKLMNGDTYGWSMFSIIIIETSITLGLCLIRAENFHRRLGRKSSESVNRELEMSTKGYKMFLETFSILNSLKQRSNIAYKGVRILQPIQLKLQVVFARSDQNWSSSTSDTGLSRPNFDVIYPHSSPLISQGYNEGSLLETKLDITDQFLELVDEGQIMIPTDWMTSEAPEMSWFFDNDSSSQADMFTGGLNM